MMWEYLSLISFIQGVNQWFLLVLLWQGCHWWPRQKEFLQGDGSGKTDFQQSNWIHSGNIWTNQTFTSAGSLLCVWHSVLSIGPLHRKPAVSGPQQALGCYCWVPSRLCTYDDEAGTGTHIWFHLLYFSKGKYYFAVSYKQNKTHCCVAAASCVDWAHWPHVTAYMINSDRINLLHNFDLMAHFIFSNFDRNQW